jgi:hypothetical protein
MAYTKTTWRDRQVQFPLRFQQAVSGSQVTLTPDEGTVIQAGTPLTAANLNNLESQYDQAVAWAKSFGLGDVAQGIDGTDLNSLDATGFYKGSSLTNCPTGIVDTLNYFFIIHMKHSSTTKAQIAIRGFRGENPPMYFRQNNNGTWLPWSQVVSQDQLAIIASGGSLVTSVMSNFVNKVSGSTTANGNIAKSTGLNANNPSLLPPSSGNWQEINGGGTAYSMISTIDGTVYGNNTNISGSIQQMLFSFDIIRILTDKYGSSIWQGKTVLADKVAIAKTIVTNIQCNWYGYGSSPTGNKATLAIYNVSSSLWDTGTGSSHTSSSITLATTSSPTPSARIDSNGFVHFLAYADPSNGTVASTINTDYVELVVTADTGLDKRYAMNAQDPWTTATLQNAWTNSSGTAAYYKDDFSTVTLRGYITGGTKTSGTILFTLPAGYRPIQDAYVAALATSGSVGSAAVLLKIEASTGAVKLATDGTSISVLALDSIMFRAEQ